MKIRLTGLLFAACLLLPGVAAACSCGLGSPENSLQQRLDRAERVHLVRIEATVLRPVPPGHWTAKYNEGGLFEPPFAPGASEYGYRVIETLKGAGLGRPRLWTANASGCDRPLLVGRFAVVMSERDEDAVWVTHCNLDQVEEFGVYPSSWQRRVDVMRRYITAREPIHVCDNHVSPPEEMRPECDKRRAAQWKIDRDEELRLRNLGPKGKTASS